MTLTQEEYTILNRAVAIAEILSRDHQCPADYVADANKARVLLLGAWIHGPYGEPAPQPFPHGRWTPKEAA